MTFTVITNPAGAGPKGFTQAQFKKLDDLYCRAASLKTLNYRSVECDFEAGTASYTYYKSVDRAPFAQFVIRRVGPRDMMYELYFEGKGRVIKSASFDRVLERLKNEIQAIK
jgi:hypothetical protein